MHNDSHVIKFGNAEIERVANEIKAEYTHKNNEIA
jgi:hypothetical protein